jgi:hypothetical protein
MINSRRLSDPRFARYYASHHGEHFLDAIENEYFEKLRFQVITREDFLSAMDLYVWGGQSGSQGSDRQEEAEHIVSHVLSKFGYAREKGD